MKKGEISKSFGKQNDGWRIIKDCNLPLNGSIGWSISLKASAIREEQIAFVGSPAPIPIKFLLNFFGMGAGDPTKAICSSLIAEAFKEIDHPILPFKGKLQSLIMRHPSFCLPKDFDISPFFKVIKPSPQNSY